MEKKPTDYIGRQIITDAFLIVEAEKIKKREAKAAERAAKEAALKAAKAAAVKAAADRAQARADGADPAADAGADADPDAFEFGLGPDPTEVRWKETTRNGDPVKGFANALLCVEAMGLTCRHDTFLDKYTVEGERLGEFSGELNDPLVRKFRERCVEIFGGFEPGKDASFDALQQTCEQNRFDSLRAQLDVLVWDKVPRVDRWLTTYLGVEDSELHQAYGRLVLMAAVRRPYDPGCVFQHVLVLEGPEGTDKSSTVKVLACGQAEQRPLYFSDSPILHLKEREQQELTKGVWFYEIAELAGMKRADQHAIKRFITAEEDRARAAYAHFNRSQARIPVFIGTFNTDANTGGLVEYLNPGDRRRWWGVLVGKEHPVDIPALQRDRWQLFAEAKVMAQYEVEPWDESGEVRWRSLRLPRKLWAAAGVEQQEREFTSPISDRLSTLYNQLIANPKRSTLGDDNDISVSPGADFIVGKVEVWVSAHLVGKLVGSLDPSGRSTAGAMGAIGWKRVRDRRNGVFPDPVRGYVHGR